MLIARQKKRENIAEYLLYMWQVEDLIRAYKLDVDAIQANIIDKFDQPEPVKAEMREWYEGLIEMMRHEHVEESGHLQINKNVVIDLTGLHNELLKTPDEVAYSAAYYKTLPFIVELRTKSPDKSIYELETCFSALYGFLLLRLQAKEVSGETQAAISQISSFLRLLAEKYKKEQETTDELS
ncbi:MAG: hypothetical protein H6Q14_2255 [Bacteroidetes bacterium]|nr:hypothetical protein [Bacteroidota bacterium]